MKYHDNPEALLDASRRVNDMRKAIIATFKILHSFIDFEECKHKGFDYYYTGFDGDRKPDSKNPDRGYWFRPTGVTCTINGVRVCKVTERIPIHLVQRIHDDLSKVMINVQCDRPEVKAGVEELMSFAF